MREILFRGQIRRRGEKTDMAGRLLSGIWAEGGIFQGSGDYSIIYTPSEKFTVYSDTVGQYTGVTDKNGKKIFEGDVVKAAAGNLYRVEYSEKYARFVLRSDGQDMPGYDIGRYELAGNIYDNPEWRKV